MSITLIEQDQIIFSECSPVFQCLQLLAANWKFPFDNVTDIPSMEPRAFDFHSTARLTSYGCLYLNLLVQRDQKALNDISQAAILVFANRISESEHSMLYYEAHSCFIGIRAGHSMRRS